MTTKENVTIATQETGWISANEGGKRLGVARVTFVKVAEAGGVRRKQYPSLRPVYSAEDVQRLIDESVTQPH